MKYLIYIILFILILFNIYRLGQKSVSPSIIEKVDIITKVDTVVVYKPVKDTVYLTKYITDTLYTTDSIKTPVNVPISTTIYKDSTYYAQISGFKASLDTLMVFPKETIIYKEKTLEIKEKPPLIKHRCASWCWVFTF